MFVEAVQINQLILPGPV